MKIIQAWVVKVDNFTFAQCGPSLKDINCDSATVQGMAWMDPVYNNGGVLQEYMKNLESAKPSPDAIRVIIVKTTQPETHTYYIAVADGAAPTIFTDLCNACCGATPTTPTYIPPQPVTENCPCIDGSGNYNFNWPLPTNPNALLITMSSASFNGAYGTPSPPATFANNAAVLTWLLANWTAYGTFSLVGTSIKLASATVKCAGMSFQLVPATYCLDGGTTQTADSIVFQTNATGPVNITTKFPGGTVTFSSANVSALQYVLSQLMPGTFSITAGPTNKLQYTGLLKPVKLQLAGVDGATFSSGVCNNVFTFAIPVNPSSFNYFITTNLFNGVAGVPVPLVGGWATTGAMLMWLNTNWSAYGTWTIVGSNVILTSAATNTTTASVTIVVHA